MRLAAIDVGTNTALLLVADLGAAGLTPLVEEQRFVRLGEGVDAAGRVGEAAMARLRTTLREYRQTAEAWGVEEILVGATSASRDARNRDDLVAFVRQETGLPYEILSGEDEATWTFLGALSAFDDLDGRCALIDIGGGSTELVVGEAGGGAEALHYRRSLDVGAVRLTERFFSQQPPHPSAVEAARTFTRRLLEEAAAPLDRSMPFVGAAGTLLALALVEAGAASWEALSTGDMILGAGVVRRWCERLLTLSFDEVLALNHVVLEGRADVFPAGVLVLDLVMTHFQIDACRVSPRGLRHGLALRWGRENGLISG